MEQQKSLLKHILCWRRHHGRKDGAELERVALSDLPTWQELEVRAQSWPVGYRTMLTSEPLSGPELYVERKILQETLTAALGRWHAGHASLVAVVGPDGAGHTSLLNWFESHLPIGETVTRLNATRRLRSERELLDWLSAGFSLKQPVASLDDLVAQLTVSSPRVVILDDLQRMVLRAMGNSHVVHALLAVLLATQSSMLWVLSCREHGWRMLDYQYGIARYFSHIIKVPYLSKDELFQAMTRRLDASGVYAREGEPEEGDESEPLLDSGRVQEFMSASGGNMQAALFYWQVYSDYDVESGVMRVREGKGVDLSALRERGDMDMFTLAEILGNGGLTIEEHAEIFQREAVKSRVVLEQLHRLRLLEKVQYEEDDPVVYQLDSVFFLPVVTLLEAAHILY